MACGNTYTPEQAELASRSRISLGHPIAGMHLSAERSKAIHDALREFESRGEDDLPSLHIFCQDKTTIEKNFDLLIWRPAVAGLASKPPIGVAFAHSPDAGKYNGFSLTKIRNVKFQILTGKRTAFHFVTTASIPDDIRREIETANEELQELGDEHLINFHEVQEYPFNWE